MADGKDVVSREKLHGNMVYLWSCIYLSCRKNDVISNISKIPNTGIYRFIPVRSSIPTREKISLTPNLRTLSDYNSYI